MSPPVPKKDWARTCEENKAVLCVSCFAKSGNVRPVNTVTEALMKAHHPSGSFYTAQNPFLPTKICMSCKNKLVRLSQVIMKPLSRLINSKCQDQRII